VSVEVDSEKAARAWREVEHHLPDAICAALVEIAKANVGIEICGFILEDETLVNVTNVSLSPSDSFEMEKSQMLSIIKGKKGILATYHSHPSGRKWPSRTDTEHMAFLYKQGCPWRYIIVTTDGVFEFEHNERS